MQTTHDCELTCYQDVNELYNNNFDPRPFTPFERKLFNNKLTEQDLSSNEFNNADDIYSIINYYSSVDKNEIQQIKYIQKLLVIPNETRGYLKLGCHFLVKRELTKALSCFKSGANKGNLHCYGNAGVVLYQLENYDEALGYFCKAIELGYYKCYMNLIIYYFNIKHDMHMVYQCALHGALNNQEDCLEILVDLFESKTDSFHILTKLNKTSPIIQQYLLESRKYFTESEIEVFMKQDIIITNSTHDLLSDINGNIAIDLRLQPDEIQQMDNEVDEIARQYIIELIGKMAGVGEHK